MVMSTISENLQTIKSSTDAIKQAIIDKGGTISGDITTWADAISGIETGNGSSGQELIFEGNIENYEGPSPALDIYGDLTNPVEEDGYVIAVVHDSSLGRIDYIGISHKLLAVVYDTSVEISIFNASISDNDLVSMFFISVDFSKIIPIKINS